MGSALQKIDLIAEKPSDRLHFGKEANHKTVIGGIGTILAVMLFLVLAIIKLTPILNKTNPYLFSQEVPF